MFGRLRVLCQGQLIEDIDLYSTCHQMFDVLQSEHVRNNEDVEGFGVRYDNKEGKELIEFPKTDTEPYFFTKYVNVDVGDTKTVSFTPLSGIISQGKMIPIRYCPLTFEFEVCSNLSDPIISPADTRWNAAATAEANTKFGSGTNFSSSWQILNPVIKCDVCRMDNELENQFAQRFLSGQTIPINFSTFVVQQQALAGKTPSVNITRALSRLKSVFCTFTGIPGSVASTDKLGEYEYMFLKSWNDFFHPMAHSRLYNKNEEFEIALQIGGKKFPEYPLSSVSETFSALRKCMGIQQSSFHSIDISPYEYRTHKFIVGIDTEKVLQASFSGENIKNGSLLTLMMKNLGTNGANWATNITVVMHADCILNIRDTGVEVLD